MYVSHLITAIVLGYGLGCLQFSYILGRLFARVDIRKVGNGNAGASNAALQLGWAYGVAVGILDIGKAVASLLLIRFFYQGLIPESELFFLMFLNGYFVILGHNFPFYLGFQGGKGTASLLGLLLVLDYRMGLMGFAAILLITVITDYIAYGTIGLVIVVVASTIYFQHGMGSILLSLLIALMSIYKHLPNLKRIQLGEEKGLRKALRKK